MQDKKQTDQKKKQSILLRIRNASALDDAEKEYRMFPNAEIMPLAINTSFCELATRVMPDLSGSSYSYPLYFYLSRHMTTIGVRNLSQKARDFLEDMKKDVGLDILSISSGLDGDSLVLTFLVRVYDMTKVPPFRDIYRFLGETEEGKEAEPDEPRLIIPDGMYYKYTNEEKKKYQEDLAKEQKVLKESTVEHPFLNGIDHYVPRQLPKVNEQVAPIYNLTRRDRQIDTILGYESFIKIFQQCMRYVTSVEKDSYIAALYDEHKKKEFLTVVRAYIDRTFIQNSTLPREDVPVLMKKIDRALFQLYIVQDLIDDPEITDVIITNPDCIRVRIGGRAYLSDITFIDKDDYIRFVNSIVAKNGIDVTVPSQTFTDERDENYILRFSFTSPYITPSGYPIIHIRKVMRDKLMSDDLIRLGMMDEKIRDYLIDCGKYSRGMVFAGPPGSGKTVCLNWFLEDAYYNSDDILVIQENDELFAYRKGVMFEHVVRNPGPGQRPCSLEDLGQMALVAGANVFVIGEVKGAEICSAITLSNSGCRTALTIHSNSSTDAVDKMADLAMRGYATNFDQAKRMMKSFQTIVYLEDFQIVEISEIAGYDDEKQDMIYRPIYRRPLKERRLYQTGTHR